MNKLYVNFNNECGKIKPMHAVNNGPVYKAGEGQRLSNMADYKEIGIPYARNHDASFLSTYGGEHTVDVNFIFPNFDADPYDEASYDFACTDEYIRVTELAGTETFYRLGSKIEHGVKKYNTLPPKDFKKWAIICEHIIKHYNYGWANGFHYNLQYWEIWNEPDQFADDAPDKTTWGGTADEFFEFFNIACGHLKEKFPALKIGGPAVCWYQQEWLDRFFSSLTVKPDFFSWHSYARDVNWMAKQAYMYREILDKYGLQDTESILNEWNYVKGWIGEDFDYTVRQISKLKGAAFTLSTMLACQHAPVDMLMYYDARPCAFNGLWTPYVYDRLKCYYSFVQFNTLYRLGTSVEVKNENDHLYICAAKNDKEAAIVISHFDDEDNGEGAEFTLDIDGLSDGKTTEYYLLDEDHDLEKIDCSLCMKDGKFKLNHNASLMIKYV